MTTTTTGTLDRDAADLRSESSATPSQGALWTGRVLSAIAVLPLLLGAVMSIARPPMVVENTIKSGYAEKLILPLGITNLACTLLYLFPRTAVLGAILLTGYLGGATATHVRLGEPFFIPVLVGVLLWLGLFLRDPRVRALVPFRR